MKIKTYEKRVEEHEKMKSNSKGQKTYSGDALKQKINNKEIPL